MNEERMKILEMLANGIINANEANELLATLDKNKVEFDGKIMSEGKAIKAAASKFLYVKILSAEGDKVNINVPLNLVKTAIKTGSFQGMLQKSLNGVSDETVKQSIDFDLIVSLIENDVAGNIIDIESAEGDKVNIYIE